jgi:hypothetical protein
MAYVVVIPSKARNLSRFKSHGGLKMNHYPKGPQRARAGGRRRHRARSPDSRGCLRTLRDRAWRTQRAGVDKESRLRADREKSAPRTGHARPDRKISKILFGILGSGTGRCQPSSRGAHANSCGETVDNYYFCNLDM